MKIIIRYWNFFFRLRSLFCESNFERRFMMSKKTGGAWSGSHVDLVAFGEMPQSRSESRDGISAQTPSRLAFTEESEEGLLHQDSASHPLVVNLETLKQLSNFICCSHDSWMFLLCFFFAFRVYQRSSDLRFGSRFSLSAWRHSRKPSPKITKSERHTKRPKTSCKMNFIELLGRFMCSVISPMVIAIVCATPRRGLSAKTYMQIFG